MVLSETVATSVFQQLFELLRCASVSLPPKHEIRDAFSVGNVEPDQRRYTGEYLLEN